MKKLQKLIIRAITISLLIISSHGVVMALPQTATGDTPTTDNRPPIIPVGTYDMPKGSTINSPKNGQIQTLKLPGASNDDGKLLQSTVIPTITNTVIALTGGLALLFVIISGIQLLTAFGNEEKVTTAKKTLAWSIIGLLIAILSYAIVQIIVSIKI